MNAIDIKNLTFAYDSKRPILQNVNLTVKENEIFIIAGSSGSGKTTLCRIICGIIPHAIKGTITGSITIKDTDTSKLTLPQTSLLAGLVFQDPDSQIISTTLEDEIAFGLENSCTPPDEIRHRVDELLKEFGLENERAQNPARLSGGQKKLLTIAATIAPSPPILILDEPMSGLDDQNRSLVLSTIYNQHASGRTIIIVEHDLKSVQFADKWLLLDNGSAIACAPPHELLKNKESLVELGVWA
ncbi:MAG: energy-coupling factor ABC transporter ATP-binding protein [Oscillospiraceae bacterium]|nr:energy-coupling factor ABC transporter ATP-binding protein [Oscillospiraceae bacterium]MCL2126283.1 energy-coupling factor ABC transporter ATP-binding protein [Oscillospiraceae bacterium]